MKGQNRLVDLGAGFAGRGLSRLYLGGSCWLLGAAIALGPRDNGGSPEDTPADAGRAADGNDSVEQVLNHEKHETEFAFAGVS